MNAPVLVIGAGTSGLMTAYYLTRAGIPFRLVERTNGVGTTWAQMYPSLRLNTLNIASSLPGMPTVWRGGFYMRGRDLYAHIQAFFRRYPAPVEFGVTVERVAPDGGAWRVETDRWTACFRCVVVATGKWSNPVMPDITGMDAFRGTLVHAQAVTDPAAFAGQRVLIVGAGATGSDLAVALVGVAAQPVLLAVNRDIVFARMYPLGIPEGLWKIAAKALPTRLRRPLLDRVLYRTIPDAARLGLTLAHSRDARVGTGTPVRGMALVRALRRGTVAARQTVVRLTPTGAVFHDGRADAVDAVILATGYRPAIGYLDFPYRTDSDGWALRDADDSQQLADAPGVYIVGRFYRGLGPLYNARHEAQIAVRQIAARLHESAV